MKNHDFGSAVFAASQSVGIGVLLALAISVAFHPPKSRLETMGLAASGIAGVVYLGAFVIEYMGWQGMSIDSQIWIRICCGVPCWFCWQIIGNQLERWRKARNPAKRIKEDLERFRGR